MTKLLLIRGPRLCGALGLLLLTQFSVLAQQDPTPVSTEAPPLDDITERNIVFERQPLAYQPIREADILWEKRIWRVIDTREKINLPFRAPESPLFQILKEAALAGDIPVYSTENERFTKRLSTEEVLNLSFKIDTILTINVETQEEEIQVVRNDIDWEQVKRFRIKESWFFDSKTSTLRVRILGIAPMIDVLDENGDFKFEQPLFWVYYPAARELLAQHKVITPAGNLAVTTTWEDWFEMRHFSSFITKENNVQDLRLQDSYAGVDLLLKAEQIENTLFNLEHDMWTW
jgi:gliding motility associated protien GldN